MSERGDNMQKYHEGQFSPMDGEKIDPEKLAEANKRLRRAKSGKGAGGEDGVFETDEPARQGEDNEKAE